MESLTHIFLFALKLHNDSAVPLEGFRAYSRDFDQAKTTPVVSLLCCVIPAFTLLVATEQVVIGNQNPLYQCKTHFRLKGLETQYYWASAKVILE